MSQITITYTREICGCCESEPRPTIQTELWDIKLENKNVVIQGFSDRILIPFSDFVNIYNEVMAEMFE